MMLQKPHLIEFALEINIFKNLRFRDLWNLYFQLFMKIGSLIEVNLEAKLLIRKRN